MRLPTRVSYILAFLRFMVIGALLLAEIAAASGSIKQWSGIHLGNRPDADWDGTLFTAIDGEQPGGIWPKAVVFMSSQLYNLTRDENCRIRTGAGDVTTGRPGLLAYLQRASQNGVRIIVRVHPSPGNFDESHTLHAGPISGIGYCSPSTHRPAYDLADEIKAIHNYNQANSIIEWGFEPANEPNIEWYFADPSLPPPFRRNSLQAWQDMGAYFQTVWLNVPYPSHVLTPPMTQGQYAEGVNTGADGLDGNCPPRLLEDNQSTGYGVMQSYYTTYNDGIDWHNYWRLGYENSCRFKTAAHEMVHNSEVAR